MNEEFFKELMQKGSTVINNLILLNIKNLNMSAEEFLIYTTIQMYGQKGVEFPAPSLISKHLGIEQNEVLKIIQNLIQKRIIDINTKINNNHQQQDVYDLTPVYRLLATITDDKKNEKEKQDSENKVIELFKMIEVEFGRPLSPIEQETIHDWLDNDGYNIDLIKLALKESILNQVYSLKYMDRILLNWEKQNIKTPSQLDEYKRRNEY
ncbi:DnaD domain protein [Companilactobacillus sp. DQM5]|uniref:DnaD domain protein n=1 Tax=Companilactobacillus sp. DQM5 TaxID=3463359 RepID=UPI00405A2AA9